MARPKAFDPEQILNEAMQIFWTRGYANTSIQDLTEGLGIHRGSLYDTFGDKKQLYLRALKRYRKMRNEKMRSILQNNPPLIRALELLLGGIVNESLNDPSKRGCFIVNTSTEFGTSDPEIATVVMENQATVEKLFFDAILSAQNRGEIDSGINALEMAQFYFNTIQGIRVISRTETDPHKLHNIVKVAARALDANDS